MIFHELPSTLVALALVPNQLKSRLGKDLVKLERRIARAIENGDDHFYADPNFDYLAAKRRVAVVLWEYGVSL